MASVDPLVMVEASLRDQAFELEHAPSDDAPLGKLSLAGGRRKRRYGADAARAIDDALSECAVRACAGEPEWVQGWIRGMKRGVLERLGQCHEAEPVGGPDAKRARLSTLAGRCVAARARNAALERRAREAARAVAEYRDAALEAIDEQRAYEARLFRGGGDGAPRAPSAQERDHVEAVEAAARDIKRTAETVPGKAEELRELIAVVEARCAERRRAGGDAPAGDGDGGSSAPGSAQSHVVQPVARLAQHLSQTESLVDFLGGAGDP